MSRNKTDISHLIKLSFLPFFYSSLQTFPPFLTLSLRAFGRKRSNLKNTFFGKNWGKTLLLSFVNATKICTFCGKVNKPYLTPFFCGQKKGVPKKSPIFTGKVAPMVCFVFVRRWTPDNSPVL